MLADTSPQAVVRSLFSTAARDRPDLKSADERARLLASATVGCWVAVRIDPDRAVDNCDAMLGQIASWRRPEFVT